MATSSHPNSTPYVPKIVLNPTPISFAPPRTTASMGTTPVGDTDSPRKTKKGKRPKSNGESPAVSTETKKAKKPKSNGESPAVSESKKVKKARSNEDSPSVSSRPDWLPETWKIIEHIREGGKSAGSKDKYYIDPESGKRLRSLQQVRYHLGLDEPPKTNSPKAKASSSKKRKADNGTAINGEASKKSKVEDANGEESKKGEVEEVTEGDKEQEKEVNKED